MKSNHHDTGKIDILQWFFFFSWNPHSDTVHVGTGSKAFNSYLQYLPGPVCSQSKWRNGLVNESLIRSTSLCICVNVSAKHIFYGKDCFLKMPVPFLIKGEESIVSLYNMWCISFWTVAFRYLSIRISCSSTDLEIHHSCWQLADFQLHSFGQMFWRRPHGALLW